MTDFSADDVEHDFDSDLDSDLDSDADQDSYNNSNSEQNTNREMFTNYERDANLIDLVFATLSLFSACMPLLMIIVGILSSVF